MLEKTLPVVTKTTPMERRGKRLRQFLAALGRYQPLLVVSLDVLTNESRIGEEGTMPVLVVSDDGLDWATVDRLSDGVVQAAVYSESELLRELNRSDSLLYEALAKGTILYGTEEARERLLHGLPVNAKEGWQTVRV
ncbi:MAG: hypothetical protein ACUVWR_13610 [Anaerolineae bacterium]